MKLVETVARRRYPTGPMGARLGSVAVLLIATMAFGQDAVLATVKTLSAGLQEVLRAADTLNYESRYKKLGPILDQGFDFEFMARQAIGREWDALPADQRQRWVETFRDLTVATYASRFDHANQQSFEVLDAEPAAHDTVMVRSRIVEPGKESVDLTYRLRQNDGRWQVIDVYLKGSVSEIALRRSEFSAVLKRDGFDALLAAARRKIESLAPGQATP